MAYTELRHPRAVELPFDNAEQIIGIRSVDTHSDTAHFVRTPTSPARGPYLITAIAFLHHYGIDTTHSRRWPAHIDNHILCLRLTEPASEVTSNRARPTDLHTEFDHLVSAEPAPQPSPGDPMLG